jgi:L-ascorbate metabolism protein UlaG (beta-lactamase superfamily)
LRGVERGSNAAMLTHRALIDDIAACAPPRGTIAAWWLGQHGFVLKGGSTVIYLDPFLTAHPERTVAPLLAPAELANAQFVFGSHDHGDHIDRPVWPAIAAAAPGARFVVPRLLIPRLALELGIPSSRFVGIDDITGDELDGARFTGVAAAHEFLDRDPATGSYPYMGVSIEFNGVTLFHSGDSCVYEGYQTKLSRWRFDAMILPINGRCAKRLAAGCIGNMTYQEAADLAGALAPGMTIPAHFEMFEFNSLDPTLFTDYMRVKYPKLAVHRPRHGERFDITARARAAAAG